MSYFLGIDGGGSNLRVALVGESLSPIVEARRGTVNPNVVGFDEAKALIQSAVQEVLIAGAPLSGVGIGIAGASLAHDWMRDLITEVLPDVPVTTAIDVEIALVGAHGAREGVLVLAGTGSVAYGVNAQGEAAQAGGWGYLLGDEGSGYWLGLQAIRALTQWSDGFDLGAEVLAQRVMARLNLTVPREVIRWVYPPSIKEIAALAPLVLSTADEGDPYAARIVLGGAWSLSSLVTTVVRRLGVPTLPIAFAGGLLTADNHLSRDLCNFLSLPTIPQPKYPPVIGAALLAKIMLNK